MCEEQEKRWYPMERKPDIYQYPYLDVWLFDGEYSYRGFFMGGDFFIGDNHSTKIIPLLWCYAENRPEWPNKEKYNF